MNKHTPGPWRAIKSRRTLITAESGERVAECESLSDADAALIAAAPDLVATLRALTDAVEQFTNLVADDWPEIATSRALLAKLNEGGAK